jgi:hypothetical protein
MQIGFSMEQLRAGVSSAGGHRPPIGGDIDWDRVEIRRQEFNVIFDGTLSSELLSKPEDKALIQAFMDYMNSDFASAIDHWPTEYRRPADDVQRLLLAGAYAQLGKSECLELLSGAEERFPAEAAALRAVYYSKAGNTSQAVESLAAFFGQLARSPWVITLFADPAFAQVGDVVRKDPAAAQRLYPLLSQPFASYRYNYVRQQARVVTATKIGPQQVVEALAELEPDVTWTPEILEPRAKAYSALNHPLAAQAARDWQWYQEHRRASDDQGTAAAN